MTPAKIKIALVALGLSALAVLSIVAWNAHDAAPAALQLAEGVRISYTGGTRVSVAQLSGSREVRVDGEALVQQYASAQPLTVKTRLLVITANAPSEFRVIAGAKSPGERVEVIAGLIQARKAYASKEGVVHALAAGEMLLINRDIDLMEVETLDLPSTRAWRDALLASIKARRGIDSR